MTMKPHSHISLNFIYIYIYSNNPLKVDESYHLCIYIHRAGFIFLEALGQRTGSYFPYRMHNFFSVEIFNKYFIVNQVNSFNKHINVIKLFSSKKLFFSRLRKKS